jgi:glycerate 2-kinase
MRVVVAPDSFGGTLTSAEAARAIASGWRRARPGDDIVLVPLADGGEGTLDALALTGGEIREVEVADPLGRPRQGRWLLLEDGTAVIESAEACGLALLGRAELDPLRTTTYGVGQLLEAARRWGARTIAVGLGGSATVDGGAGALSALGFRIVDRAGQGLKIGGGQLADLDCVEPRWRDRGWDEVDVVLWSDVTTPLADAAHVFGPQKGATPEAVDRLERGLARWADVVEGDLGGRWRDLSGSGAAGGLGFGLAAGLNARVGPGSAAVADVVGVAAEGMDSAAVVTGEGTLDATSGAGKVIGHVIAVAERAGVAVHAVVGRERGSLDGLGDVEESSPRGPGSDPAREVAAAAERLAGRVTGA